MEPFFIDKFVGIISHFVNCMKQAAGEMMLSIYNKHGYTELQEISDEERNKIRRNNSHLSCYCYYAHVAKYRCGEYAVCRHGFRIRQLKKVTINGKILYK